MPLLLWLGKDLFQQLVMDQSDQANPVGVKATSLTLITEPSSPEIIVISDLHPIRCSGFHLDNTTTEPPAVHSNQATNTFSIWGKGKRNVSLGSMESSPDVLKGVIGQSGNDGIVMNPPGTIGGKCQQGSGKRGFDIFNSGMGISDSENRIVSWHDEMISENYGCDRVFKTAGRKNFTS